MATYKVIQDIEAEDHILGPLTLRQFIYALITAFCLYMCFIGIAKHAIVLLIMFLPPALFCGFFAFPFRQDQPTEVWALAKVRFMLKPHRRIWNQSGVKELVTVTAPKKEEHVYTNGLSRTEVDSRLEALANTLDSRGWAVKNVNVNLYSQPSQLAGLPSSDRLIDLGSMPHEVPAIDVAAADDMLDERSNPVAQQFDQMISAASQAHRQQIVQQMDAARAGSMATPTAVAPPANYWFLNQPLQPPVTPPGTAMFTDSQVVLPGESADEAGVAAAVPTAEEEAVAAQLKVQNSQPQHSYAHLKTIQPIDPNAPVVPPAPAAQEAVAAPGPRQPDPAILNLASNNDLNVATLARQAQKAKDLDDGGDEVVVSLH